LKSDNDQGAFTIKLAQQSNIHPIIAVAGKGEAFVEKLISREKGDTIIDYRKGDEAVVSGIKDAVKAAGANEVKYAFDAVSEKGSYVNISKVLAKEGGRMTNVLPGRDYKEVPDYIYRSTTTVGDSHAPVAKAKAAEGIQTGGKEFAFAFFRLYSRGLQEGWFSGHPYEVVPGGLGGVQKALADLKAGKNSATKYVLNIEDTKSHL
jgi:NADPH2:quinone reductase